MSNWLRRAWHEFWVAIGAAFFASAVLAIAAHYTAWGTKYLKFPIPLWAVVIIAAAVFWLPILILKTLLRRTYNFEPIIEVVDVSVSEADPAQKLMFPLKCNVQFRNDSTGCVDVRMSGYDAKMVTVKNVTLEVLQVNLKGWVPQPHGTDRLAVLPGQTFRAWIGIDEKNFTVTRVRELRKQMGTLRLIVNGRQMPFDL